jgi:REP element-mobilizing transposase RayT
MAAFLRYRRRLPHWRYDGSVYFVTWCVQRGVADLDGAERHQVLASILHFVGVRYDIYAAVVMNDHVHVLVRPHQGFALERIVQSWKAYTSRRFGGRSGRVWQPEYYDHVIRNDGAFDRAVHYIAGNPFSRWPEIESYPWIWLADTD